MQLVASASGVLLGGVVEVVGLHGLVFCTFFRRTVHCMHVSNFTSMR